MTFTNTTRCELVSTCLPTDNMGEVLCTCSKCLKLFVVMNGIKVPGTMVCYSTRKKHEELDRKAALKSSTKHHERPPHLKRPSHKEKEKGKGRKGEEMTKP